MLLFGCIQSRAIERCFVLVLVSHQNDVGVVGDLSERQAFVFTHGFFPLKIALFGLVYQCENYFYGFAELQFVSVCRAAFCSRSPSFREVAG